jgi:hypothetical protein
MLQGGCFCGRVRYEVTGIPFDETNCHRSICRRTTGCGTQPTFQSDDCSDVIDITTCSFDHPEAVAPRDHTHMSRKLPWIRLSDGLAQYSHARPGA